MRLNTGDELGAQKALDALGLVRLSPDGAALMRAVSRSLGIAAPRLPWAEGQGSGARTTSRRICPCSRNTRGGRACLRRSAAGTNRNTRAYRLERRTAASFRAARAAALRRGGPSLRAGRRWRAKRPEIPSPDPLTEKLRNLVAKQAARWLARAIGNAAFGPEGEFLTALEAVAETASWLRDKYPYIKAYLDDPKSLEELQADVGKPGSGYEVHHIVEQTAAAREGHSREDIDAPDNLVRIPMLKHWEITGWYMTPNDELGGLSPREYLRGKSWESKTQGWFGSVDRLWSSKAVTCVPLEQMTTDQLVARFTEIGIAQDQAELMGDIGKFSRLYRQMDATEKELRARGREARLALCGLYDHPNMQVRLNAAKRTLGVAPGAARGVIQSICDSKWYRRPAMQE